jgi:hypothetical protein
MLNGWRIKHGGTVDRRRSGIGATIAPVWIPRTGTVVIMGRTIAGKATTATHVTRLIPGTAATGETIAIKEIIATIGANAAVADDTGQAGVIDPRPRLDGALHSSTGSSPAASG